MNSAKRITSFYLYELQTTRFWVIGLGGANGNVPFASPLESVTNHSGVYRASHEYFNWRYVK